LKFFGLEHGGQLDEVQLYFLDWINFYRMLGEMPLADQPERELIEDDTRCDRWYDGYIRHITNQAIAANNNNFAPAGQDWEVPTFGG
jgi:hypothetical protein